MLSLAKFITKDQLTEIREIEGDAVRATPIASTLGTWGGIANAVSHLAFIGYWIATLYV